MCRLDPDQVQAALARADSAWNGLHGAIARAYPAPETSLAKLAKTLGDALDRHLAESLDNFDIHYKALVELLKKRCDRVNS